MIDSAGSLISRTLPSPSPLRVPPFLLSHRLHLCSPFSSIPHHVESSHPLDFLHQIEPQNSKRHPSLPKTAAYIAPNQAPSVPAPNPTTQISAMSSRLAAPVSKFTRSISTTAPIARPSHLLQATAQSGRKRNAAPAADDAEASAVSPPCRPPHLTQHHHSHRTTPSPSHTRTNIPPLSPPAPIPPPRTAQPSPSAPSP